MSDHTPAGQRSIYAHMIRGSAWAIAMRWGVRGIGLVSTMILARILVPEDFGLVAMATLTYGLLEMLFDWGVDLYLIRTPDPSRLDWDTAWTIRVLQGFFMAGLLFAMAPLATIYFGEPRVVEVIHWLALAAVARGAENVGIIKFRKDLDFASDFRFGIYGRLLAFCITVPAAVIWQTYWALVVGLVVGGILRTLLSYGMHPYRPRFALASARTILSFSLYMFLISFGRYIYEKADAFVVGGVADSASLGPYIVSSEVSTMVTAEAVVPIGRALSPSYATVIHDPGRFAPAYIHSISAIGILCFPLGIGLSSVAHDFVLVLLGSKWEVAIPLVEWLALFALINGIVQSLGTSLALMPGGEQRAMILTWVRLLMVTPAVAAAGMLWGVQAVAIAATLAALAFVPVMILGVVNTLPVTTRQILGALWRPAVAAALMATVVRLIEFQDLSPVVGLAVDVVVGAITYGIAVVALWFAAGRPAGPEKAVLEFLAGQVAIRLRH